MKPKKGYQLKNGKYVFWQDRLTYDRSQAFLVDPDLTFIQKAFRLLLKGGWLSQDRIGRALERTGTDAGAWIRDCRKPEHGAYLIDYQKVDGVQHYRLRLFDSGRAKSNQQKRVLLHDATAPENFSKATLVKLVRRMQKRCRCGRCRI